MKKKLQVLVASNRKLVSEKDETEAVVVDVSAIKELKKAVREAKKKEKDDAATIVRLQATIDSFKVPNVENAGAVSKRGIKKEKDALPQKIAVKGKKGKGKVIEESGSADDSASSHESQAPVTKRKRSSKKILAKEAELSPADESSVEGLINNFIVKHFIFLTLFCLNIFFLEDVNVKAGRG